MVCYIIEYYKKMSDVIVKFYYCKVLKKLVFLLKVYC